MVPAVSQDTSLPDPSTVERAAERIRLRMARTSADIVEIGRDLILVKEALPHGAFLPWIEAEFGMSERSARRFIECADTFKSATLADLPPTVLYALAAPSTSEPVRENVIQMAAAGEKVTAKTVADLKRKLKDAEASAKAERETRLALEGRSKEIMKERDTSQSEVLYLRSTVQQLQERSPAPSQELLPPENPALIALRAIWKDADSSARAQFLTEVSGA